MSAFNIRLKPSVYAQIGMALLALMPPLVLAFSPLQGYWLYLLALLAFIYYWQWYSHFARLRQQQMLTLTNDGLLHWFGSYNSSGRLTAGGLVAQYAVKLCWRDQSGKQHQRWILVDQCDEPQYRALARLINQSSWSAGGPDTL